MTIPSHVLLGVVIGKVTGDYKTAILVSALVDIDHLVSYIKSGVIFSPRKFWKTISDKNDPYGDQRGYLHNILIATLSSGLTFLISIPFGITFSLAYLGHLVLDSLDKSDYWPFYPNKQVNLQGFIDYFSWQELLFDLFLVGILVVLFLI